MSHRKKIALVSGGIDSTLMVKNFKFDTLVYFDTGSGYTKAEINALRRMGLSFEVVDMPDLSVTTKGGFSPLRNLILICLAINKFDADEVWVAGLRDDKVADKNEEIFKDYSDILSKSLGRDVLVYSPYYGLSKGELIQDNLHLTEYIKSTFSCYTPKGLVECGQCAACFRKWVALESNGIPHHFDSPELIDEYLSRLHVYDPDRISRILITLKKYFRVSAVDIDGILCKLDSKEYQDKIPLVENIKKVNNKKGYIILYTARLEVDRKITEKWLYDNGVKYHSLIMNKLPYHNLLDDLTSNTL